MKGEPLSLLLKAASCQPQIGFQLGPQFTDAPSDNIENSILVQICGDDPVNMIWVMRKILARPDADLEYLTINAGKLLLAILCQERLVHQAVVEAWENDFRVEAH